MRKYLYTVIEANGEFALTREYVNFFGKQVKEFRCLYPNVQGSCYWVKDSVYITSGLYWTTDRSILDTLVKKLEHT